eukprot:TRINITY_DN21370_c0_g1_i3.p1 TRINITY_DN21370_c0_g1~~TRINITY_DN21370_c0_g1_i3.p1  ORF type:complete len:129 (-),score=27.09 TRINITY_DN21370_c0_g1_i3:3-389(-)
MWNNEVVELFIAPALPAERIITHYTEIECSPHNDLYVAQITNPYGNGTDKSNRMVDCAGSGIQHNVTLDKPGGSWITELAVPWSLLTNQSQLPTEWRINLFRAVSYTHLRAHETVLDLVCRLLLEKKK